jgi:hypothetical protein
MVPATLASLDRIDWLPVNHASKIVVELAGLDRIEESTMKSSSANIFHEVNPRAVSWDDLVPAVTASFGSGVSVVPWSVWLSALEKSEAGGDFGQNPGLKLLDFYRGVDIAAEAGLQLPVLETTNTQLRSMTLRALEPVRKDWMSQWMVQWGF